MRDAPSTLRDNRQPAEAVEGILFRPSLLCVTWSTSSCYRCHHLQGHLLQCLSSRCNPELLVNSTSLLSEGRCSSIRACLRSRPLVACCLVLSCPPRLTQLHQRVDAGFPYGYFVNAHDSSELPSHIRDTPVMLSPVARVA